MGIVMSSSPIRMAIITGYGTYVVEKNKKKLKKEKSECGCKEGKGECGCKEGKG